MYFPPTEILKIANFPTLGPKGPQKPPNLHIIPNVGSINPIKYVLSPNRNQWMRMSVSYSHRGQATSLWREFPVIVKVKVWRHCSIFLALVTFILLEENGEPHHDFGEKLLCLKTSSGHCESESVEEGLLHTFWGFLWALRAQGWRKYAILRISVGGKYIFYWIYAANIWDYM